MSDSIDEMILLSHLRKVIAANQYDKLNLRYLTQLRYEVDIRIEELIRSEQ